MSSPLEKVLYTAHTHTTGGREGSGKSSDGALDLKLSPPGSGRPGANPEQLFAVGWSACFIGAMQIAGAALKIRVPQDVAVDASVSLGKVDNDSAYALAAVLTVSLPGLEREQAQQLIERAHQTCPYSRATRGNIEVDIQLA